MSKTLSSLYPTKAGMIGFNWSTSNEVTTDQTPTTSNFGQRYLFTQSTTADRTITLPSVGESEDGKFFVIENKSGYIITITPGDTDSIWTSGPADSMEIVDQNTTIVVRYDHANTTWDLIFKEGGMVRLSGLKMVMACDEIRTNTWNGTNPTTVMGDDLTERHNPYPTNYMHIANAEDPGIYPRRAYQFVNSAWMSIGDGSTDTDFDILADDTETITLSAWLKPSTVDGADYVLSHYEDNSNFWAIYRNGINIQFYSVATSKDTINQAVAAFSVSTWIHVALVRKAGEFAWYVNGIQKTYANLSFDERDFTSNLFIGQKGNTGSYWDGYMSDIVVAHSNIYSATPNAGKTDTLKNWYGEFAGILV